MVALFGDYWGWRFERRIPDLGSGLLFHLNPVFGFGIRVLNGLVGAKI